VADAVRTAAEDGSATTEASGAPGALDRARLLRLLRAAVLARWSEARDGSLLLAMQAFHAAEEELSLDEPVGVADYPLPAFTRTILAEVSHVLRSPLGAIVMLADTLASASDDLEPEAFRHRSRLIYRAALGLAALSEDLLTLTSEEELTEEATDFSLTELVERVRDLVVVVCAARGTELTIGELAQERGHRIGHPHMLARALLNLALEDGVTFTVSEPGDGAAPEEVFRVFRRDEDSDDYSMSANAVRMAGARHLVGLMGSKLKVHKDEYGLRASFRLVMPHA
jgi:two-component system sensor histidine kinase SenX3